MKTQPRPSDRELLAGLVERVAYQNAENGFCVIRFTAAHRSLPFGTLVNVCHDGCVTVRINDRVPLPAGVTSICLQPRRGRSTSTKLAMCKCLGDTPTVVPRGSADDGRLQARQNSVLLR